MKEPIEFFLSEMQGTIYYEPMRLATQSQLKISEIAEELGEKEKVIESRVYYGALRMGVWKGRTGLKAAYIEFLEDWISQRGMK